MIEKASLPHSNVLPGIACDRRTELSERLLQVIAELTAQMERENANLAAGLPAPIGPEIARKRKLADAYAELHGELRGTYPDFLSSSGELTEEMMWAVLRLRDVTEENLMCLDAAVNASRRRVEAVLSAARDAGREHATYGVNGEMPQGARLAAITRTCRV